MKYSGSFFKTIGVALTTAGVLVCALVVYILLNMDTDQAQAISFFLKDQFIPLIAIGSIFLTLIVFGIESIYSDYIRPLKTIASKIPVTYTSNPSFRINVSGSKEINTLISAINQCADLYEHQTADVTRQIIGASQKGEKERNLLAAIMAELPYAVIICNKNGRILLFNNLAKKLFTSPSSMDRVKHFIGLGRSIFHFFDKERIAHAIDEIEERINSQKTSLTSYFITPMYTDLLLSVETMPVLDHDNRLNGFILNIHDISDDVKKYETINKQMLTFEQTLAAGFEQTRSLVRDLQDLSDIEDTTNQLVAREIVRILEDLTQQFNQTSISIMDHNLSRLPLTRLSLPMFLFGLQKKTARDHNIRINIINKSKGRRIIADSYSLTAAFIFIVTNLSQITGQKEFDMTVQNFSGKMTFDLIWEGPPASQIQVENILTKKIRTLPSLGYVLKQNRAAFKIISKNRQTCSQIRIFAAAELKSIPIKKKRGAIHVGSRPEFYDFDLFQMDDTRSDLLNRNLTEIIFSVFDTETTGLDPDGGDEILSIGAVRIVNNQIVRHDVFEELIDPKRDIPLESYKIHGISHDMVEGKPVIETVLPLFKIYAYDTVLVGHNIAFDMKMLKVKEKVANTSFTNPMLDTLLLSAMLHPLDTHHDMETIANRLGVNIIGRHTALGDAMATAEIFLKLVPILNANGIFTLKNAIDASQKTYYARIKY
jgi:DNA polymerase-3 subunit epsilon